MHQRTAFGKGAAEAAEVVRKEEEQSFRIAGLLMKEQKFQSGTVEMKT